MQRHGHNPVLSIGKGETGNKSRSRRRQKLFEAITEHALDAVLIADDQRRYVEANPAACKLLGLSRDEILQRRVEDFFELPADMSIEQEGVCRLRRPDGGVLELEYRARSHFVPGLHLSILRDVTQRTRMQEDLQKRNEQLELAQAVAHLGVWEFDPNEDRVTVSEETCRLIGISAAHAEGSYGHFFTLVAPEDQAEVQRTIDSALKDGKPFELDIGIARPDGTIRKILSRGRAFPASQGGLPNIFGIMLDITEVKAAEKKFRGLLEAAPDAIVITDVQGKMLLVNSQAEHAFGRSRQQLLGQDAALLFAAGDQECYRDYLRGHLSRTSGGSLELRGVRSDGSEFPAEINLKLLETANGKQATNVIRDISERKRAEQAIQEQERLRTLAIGLLNGQEEERKRLSQELHDGLNQDLAALAVRLDSLSQQWPEVGDELAGLRHRTDEISEEVRRMAHGLHPSALEHLGLKPALQSLCRDFQARHRISVRLSTAKASSVPPGIAASLFRITQECLHNVAKHASASRVRIRLSRQSGGLTLSVADNGQGFNGAAGRGEEGLGLASIAERVRSMEGRLSVKSQPGSGTEVEVNLPLPKSLRQATTSDTASSRRRRR